MPRPSSLRRAALANVVSCSPRRLTLAALVASLAGCSGGAPRVERAEPRRLTAQELSTTGPGVEYLLPIRIVELSSQGQPLVRPEIMERSLRNANYAFRPAGVQFTVSRTDRIVAPELSRARSRSDTATALTPALLNDLRQVFPAMPPSYRPAGNSVMTRFYWVHAAALDFADDNEIVMVIPETSQAGYGFFPWQGRNMLISPGAFGSFEWNLAHELGHYLGLPHTFPGTFSDADFYSTSTGKCFMRDPATGQYASRADLWELVYATQGAGLRFFGSRDEAARLPEGSLLAKDGSNGTCTLTAGTCDTVCTATNGQRFGTMSAPASPGIGIPYMTPGGALNLGYNAMGYAHSPGCNQGFASSQIAQIRKVLQFDIKVDEHAGRTGRRPLLGQRPGPGLSALPPGPTPLALSADRAHRASLDEPAASHAPLASAAPRHGATCSLPGAPLDEASSAPRPRAARASAAPLAVRPRVSVRADSECTEARGLAGPPMVRVPAPGGASYCIDATEVTQGQYDAFRRASEQLGVPGTEHPACAGKNLSYTPPVGTDESSCSVNPAFYSPEQTPDVPVSCVDWCDAYAYCAWAGKRLCGQVGGGPSHDTSATTDQWTSACTAGGTTTFATGDRYEDGTCLDARAVEQAGTLEALLRPVGSSPACHAATAPFDQIRDLAGSRAEWQDACEGDGPDDLCAVRGAALDRANGGMSPCGQSYLAHRSAALGRSPEVGFRCCLDP